MTKYEPDPHEPHIALGVHAHDRGTLFVNNGDGLSSPDPEERRQVLARAIADRVHGKELACLRALVLELRDAFDEIEGIALFNRHKVIPLGRKDDMRIGAPKYDPDDGVPLEILPPTFKPEISEQCSGRDRWIVRFGPREDQFNEYTSFDEAAADFGERYAAWKAGAK